MLNTIKIMLNSIKKTFVRTLYVFGCGLLVSSFTGCAVENPENGSVAEENERFPVCVTLPGLADNMESGRKPLMSKATDISGEDNVKSVQIFVFRKDGVLDAYVKSSTSSASLDCTIGEKDFFAIVNAPDITNVGNVKELESMRSQLSSNSVGRFVMTGRTSAVVTTEQNNVSVDVSRLVARITVKKITNAITAPQYSSAPLVLKQIYLLNVAGDIPYSGTGEPVIWYNKAKNTGDLPELLESAALGESIASNASYTSDHHFYCYPNHTSKDSSSDIWSPRFTRLVLKMGFKDKEYYYPVTLDGIDANTIYNIEEVKITRIGSVNPDIPVSVGTVSLTVNVVPWQNGPSSNVVI